MYSENSKISIRLDSFTKQILNIWVTFSIYTNQSLGRVRLPCYICQFYSIFLWHFLPEIIGSLMRFK